MKLIKIIPVLACLASLSLLSACSEARYAAHVAKQIPMPGDSSQKSKGSFKVGSSYRIQGKRYYPKESYTLTETGVASWYGPGFHGKKTANGEIFDKNELTAAHRTLQLPSIIRVTNMTNGRSIILRVNDRGPFAHNRILDVSERGATLLGFKNNGTAKIKLQVLGDASRDVAAAAKAGRDTRGYEVALNRNKSHPITSRPSSSSRPSITPPRKPEPMTEVALSSSGQPQAQPAQAQPTQAQPTQAQPQARPLKNPLPVQSEPLAAANTNAMHSYVSASNVSNINPGKIFVQVGSFSQEQNALSLSNHLSSYGPSKVYLTRVNDRPFFRVRLGPYEDSSQAQQILAALNESGNKNAVLVID